MKTLELEELADHITEILQSLQEKGETVAVTKHGKIIAHLVSPSLPNLLALGSLPQWLTQMPAGSAQPDSDPTSTEIDARGAKNAGALDDLRRARINFDRLVAELGVQWPEGFNAVDAVRDARREL